MCGFFVELMCVDASYFERFSHPCAASFRYMDEDEVRSDDQNDPPPAPERDITEAGGVVRNSVAVIDRKRPQLSDGKLPVKVLRIGASGSVYQEHGSNV